MFLGRREMYLERGTYQQRDSYVFMLIKGNMLYDTEAFRKKDNWVLCYGFPIKQGAGYSGGKCLRDWSFLRD